MNSQSSVSILVVDDLPDNILLVRRFLEREGHEIRAASSGEEALRMIEERPPDLVLLDVMMPGIDGIETAKRIKAMPIGFIPVVLITAFGASEVKRRGLEAGAEDFISKPFDPEELVARIRSLLRTKRLYNDLRRANRRMENELEAVAELQRSLLPSDGPQLDGLQIHDLYIPSRAAGGDYYDYVPVGPGRLGVAIGDASGHGPHAAVLMAMAKVALHICRDHWAKPAALLNEASSQLARFVPPGQFITLFYGVLDLPKATLTCATAGHCPPIMLRANGETERLEIPPGLPLGLEDGRPFEQRTFPFRRGDRLFLYTDGLIEAQDSGNELFGIERLVELLREHSKLAGDELNAKLVESARIFSDADEFRDDCTMLLAEHVGQ